MAEMEIIERVSLSEVLERFGIAGEGRERRLILCPRKERPAFQKRGETITVNHPVIAVFHRPGPESQVLIDDGFDPLSASYQLLDLHSDDINKWTAGLLGDGWIESSTHILAVPPGYMTETRMDFPTQIWKTLRHPSLNHLERLPMQLRPDHVVGKAFVHLPKHAQNIAPEEDSMAAMMAKTSVKKSDVAPQAVGITQPAAQTPTPVPIPETSLDATPGAVPAPEAVPAPVPIPEPMPIPSPMAVPAPVAIPTPMDIPETGDGAEPEIEKTVEESTADEMPAIEEDTPIEREVKDMIAKLRKDGLEPMEVMSHPDFASLTERAIATGMDEYAIFMMLNS
ncbi:MAG: hypothetical protein CL992_04800 [Euryarchaeota archaeon]|nr:hypothetical protein [Euryarchaeota archaeon]